MVITQPVQNIQTRRRRRSSRRWWRRRRRRCKWMCNFDKKTMGRNIDFYTS